MTNDEAMYHVCCRPREGGDPVNTEVALSYGNGTGGDYWMPAYAGMTWRDARGTNDGNQ